MPRLCSDVSRSLPFCRKKFTHGFNIDQCRWSNLDCLALGDAGNIRVFCRVRPFLQSEKNARAGPLTTPGIDLVKTARKDFQFDRVFQPTSVQGRQPCIKKIVTAGQFYSSWGCFGLFFYHLLMHLVFHYVPDDVFAEVEPIIRSALDGHNVCIFAYGQTGTGKFQLETGSALEHQVLKLALLSFVLPFKFLFHFSQSEGIAWTFF